MTDDIENLLTRFRPAGPPPGLRDKIVATPLAATPARAGRSRFLLLFRTGIAAAILFSFALLHAANDLNQQTAAAVGVGPPRWTPEAQQAADLIDPNGSAGRQYIALCLLADRVRVPHNPPRKENSDDPTHAQAQEAALA